MATNSTSDLDFLTRFALTESENGFHNVLAEQDYPNKTPSLTTFTTKERGLEAVRRLRRVLDSKCYVTKDPLLYALARIIRNTPVSKDHDEDDVREGAYKLALDACESALDLFTFVEFDKAVAEAAGEQPQKKKAGWGRGMKRLVWKWYDKDSPMKLATEVTKCKSARGWTHKDVIRLSHMRPDKRSKGHSVVFNYLNQGKEVLDKFSDIEDTEVQEVVNFFKALESLKCSKPTEKEIVRSLVEKYKFTERQIPTHLLQLKETFEGMLGHMDLVDVFRNIPKMASLGMLDHVASQASQVIDRIGDMEAVKEQKVPPIVIFIALRKYETNRQKKWVKNRHIVNSLHMAFKASVQCLPKIGKRTLLAVHIDNKITKQRVAGANYLTPIMPCALMADFLIQTEEQTQVVFFHDKVVELKLHPGKPLAAIVESIVKSTKEAGNSPYDICEPIKWALSKQKPFDNILIMSDKKVVSSQQGFHDIVKQYRTAVSLPNAKVAFLGLSDFNCIIDKNDLNMLEVSGFNEKIPPLLYNFFLGNMDITGDDAEQEGAAAPAAP